MLVAKAVIFTQNSDGNYMTTIKCTNRGEAIMQGQHFKISDLQDIHGTNKDSARSTSQAIAKGIGVVNWMDFVDYQATVPMEVEQ